MMNDSNIAEEVAAKDQALINSFLNNPCDIEKEADVIELFSKIKKFPRLLDGESVMDMALRHDSR